MATRFYIVSPSHYDGFGYGDLRRPDEFRAELFDHARWADANGITGIVFYTFGNSLDPWSVAGTVLSSTARLRPMIALQPFHMHPYFAAKSIASLSYLYERAIDINLVAGFSSNELKAIGDSLDPLKRLERLAEYVGILRRLLIGETTFKGNYYELEKSSTRLTVSTDLLPCIFMPGGSHPAFADIIKQHADSSLLMAKPVQLQAEEIRNLSVPARSIRHTIIVGIVARNSDEAAWTAAEQWYAGGQKDRMAARMLVANTVSTQHKLTSELARKAELHDTNLWYGAARTGIDCPKLVGSYEVVRAALARYVEVGVTDVVVDLPHHVSEYEHILQVIQPLMAGAQVHERRQRAKA